MIDLQDCAPTAVSDFCRQLLYEPPPHLTAFEQVAQYAATAICTEFKDTAGDPLFALLRIYRVMKYDELPADLQAAVDPAEQEWLVLVGSSGVEAHWCNRHDSRLYKCMPLREVMQSPMMRAALDQMNLRWWEQRTSLLFDDALSNTVRYFYVPEAIGNPCIPNQAEFVIPYQIASVIGFGGALISGATYMCVGFTHSPVERSMAISFARMGMYMTALLSLYNDPLWVE